MQYRNKKDFANSYVKDGVPITPRQVGDRLRAEGIVGRPRLGYAESQWPEIDRILGQHFTRIDAAIDVEVEPVAGEISNGTVLALRAENSICPAPVRLVKLGAGNLDEELAVQENRREQLVQGLLAHAGQHGKAIAQTCLAEAQLVISAASNAYLEGAIEGLGLTEEGGQ